MTQVDVLKYALEEAKQTIAEQQKMLEELTEPPLPYATVVAKHKDTMSIVSSGGMYEVRVPEFEVKIGDTITITANSHQAVEKQVLIPTGETAVVRTVIDEFRTEVDYNQTTRLVFNGEGLRPVERGDKVVLDRTTSVIVQNLGKDAALYNVTDDVNVKWEDIGGLEDAKASLIEAIELPHRYPELYDFYHKRQTKGILLYGAAGCGKTMLGKATATSLKMIYANESGVAGFIYVKAPEILNKYVGNSEATIRQLFQRATDFKHQYGYPAVLFIDEADAILAKRGTGKSSDMEQTIVPMFLSEMDGLNQSDAIVLLATNRIDRLDTAVIREGRIDYKIKITRPSVESVKSIFMVHLRNLPSVESHDCLANIGCVELFSKDRTLYHITTDKYGVLNFDLRHVISGSMVANVVDRATMIALRRDIDQKGRTGIYSNDIVKAVDGVYKSNLDVDYKDDIAEFTLGFRENVMNVEKVRQ